MAASKQCPNCGSALFWAEDIGSYCTSCGWKEPPRQAPAAPKSRSTGYIPGLYSTGAIGSIYVQEETEMPRFFNWAACFLTWIWCLGMRMWGWALAAFLIPLAIYWLARLIGTISIWANSFSGFIVAFVIVASWPIDVVAIMIYLGFAGNELAWKSRKFESVDQFRRVQGVWTAVAIIVVFVVVVAILILIAFAAQEIQDYQNFFPRPQF